MAAAPRGGAAAAQSKSLGRLRRLVDRQPGPVDSVASLIRVRVCHLLEHGILCSPGPGGRRRYIGDVEGSIPLPCTPRDGALSRARPGACRGRARRGSAPSSRRRVRRAYGLAPSSTRRALSRQAYCGEEVRRARERRRGALRMRAVRKCTTRANGEEARSEREQLADRMEACAGGARSLVLLVVGCSETGGRRTNNAAEPTRRE